MEWDASNLAFYVEYAAKLENSLSKRQSDGTGEGDWSAEAVFEQGDQAVELLRRKFQLEDGGLSLLGCM